MDWGPRALTTGSGLSLLEGWGSLNLAGTESAPLRGGATLAAGRGSSAASGGAGESL